MAADMPGATPEPDGPTLGEVYWGAYIAAVDTGRFDRLALADIDGETRNAVEAGAAAAAAAAIARQPAGEPQPAPELAAIEAERDKLQRACITLGWVVDGMARSLRAAWIDISQGDLKGAAQWVLESVPDVDDSDPEDQWDGTETSHAWFDRTRPEPLASRTAHLGKAAMLADKITAEPKAAPELAAAMAETRQLRELVIDMLTVFGPSGSGMTARVGQVQIRKWRKRAGLGEPMAAIETAGTEHIAAELAEGGRV